MSNIKSEMIHIVGGVAAVIILTVMGVMAVRYLNNISVQHKVVEVKPGVECVIATSTDGVAIDCNWEEL